MPIALLALYNEIYKRILIAWNYKFDAIVQIIMIGTVYIGACFLVGGGHFNETTLATVFIGYIVWFYARITVMSTSKDLHDEAESGTLEQTYMTPAPTEFLIIGRMLAMLITSTIMVILVSIILLLLLHISFGLSWLAVSVLLITLVGLFGFALILGGATLVFKQVEGFADLIQNALLFLTGSLLPITNFPGWLATIAESLPTTLGIEVLRQLLLHGQSVSVTLASDTFKWLLVNSAIYLVIGWLIFKGCERVAKQQGTLSHY